MVMNWLYGKPAERAYRVDLDTVREVAQAIREQYPEISLRFYVRGRPGEDDRKVHERDLPGLSLADKRRLIIHAQHGSQTNPEQAPVVSVSFARSASWVSVSEKPGYVSESADHPLVRRILGIISDSGRPLVRRRRIIRPLRVAAWLPAVAVGASWLWVLFSVPMPAAVVVFGSALVALAVVVALDMARRVRMTLREQNENIPTGHLVLGETRETTAARRADHRRDLRVAVYSVLATAAAAVLLWALGIGR